MKNVLSRCLKNHFRFDLNRMESYHPEHLLLYHKFLKKLIFGVCIGLLQDPPFYCKWYLLIDNSVRRLLLIKIVLRSLFADAVDGLRPNSAYTDQF